MNRLKIPLLIREFETVNLIGKIRNFVVIQPAINHVSPELLASLAQASPAKRDQRIWGRVSQSHTTVPSLLPQEVRMTNSGKKINFLLLKVSIHKVTHEKKFHGIITTCSTPTIIYNVLLWQPSIKEIQSIII